MIRLLHRRFAVKNYKGYMTPKDRKPVIWNGQVGANSCIADYDTKDTWDKGKVCPTIDKDLDNHSLTDGQTVGECDADVDGNPNRKRQEAGGSCPYIPGDGSGGGGGQTVSFTDGPTAAPTCVSGTGCGGHLCTGFYCVANPTGVPPSYMDPKDPKSRGPVPTKTVTSPETGPTDDCDDGCKVTNGNACTCNENGCDEDSPACCANRTCPTCYCSGAHGCSADSPACCRTNSCAWSTTGGGGGHMPEDDYSIWSYKYQISGGGGQLTPAFEVKGFRGVPDDPCRTESEWSITDNSKSNIQLSYDDIDVYDEKCSYQASVSGYDNIDKGVEVGALTCTKWRSAKCYRGDYEDKRSCGAVSGNMAEELDCRW